MMSKKIIGLLAIGVLIGTISTAAVFKNIYNKPNNYDLKLDGGRYNYSEYDGLELDSYNDLQSGAIQSEEELASLKDRFTNEYGNEDTFKTVYEDDEFLEEINGAKGIIRYKYKTTNEVEEYNYFEELDKRFKFSQLNNDEKIQFLKDEFTNKYGNEDIFKTIYEDDEFLEEVNGAKGIIRYKDKATNEVEEINYFEDIIKYANKL